MYNLTISKEQLSDLWRLREYAGAGPIAQQVRQAVSEYLKFQEQRIGCPVADLSEAIERHKKEEEMNR